jgi:hypothetical protein
MTVTGQKILSVYDPATGTVVQINTIAEDGEFEKKAQYIKNSQGNRLFSGHESRAEFLCFDLTGLAQLKTWMQNRTPVRFVTYGLDEHILWYEDTYITVDEKVGYSPYKRSGFRLYFEKSGGVHSIEKGNNIVFASGYKDNDNDEKIDGMVFAESGTFTYDSHSSYYIQKCTCTGSGTLSATYNIIYPISGANLKFGVIKSTSEDIVALSTLITMDFSDSQVSASDNIQRNTIQNLITLANTYKIRIKPLRTGSAFNDGQIAQWFMPYLGNSSPSTQRLY